MYSSYTQTNHIASQGIVALRPRWTEGYHEGLEADHNHSTETPVLRADRLQGPGPGRRIDPGPGQDPRRVGSEGTVEVLGDRRTGPGRDPEDRTTEVLLVPEVADPLPDQDPAMAGSKDLDTEDQGDLRAGRDTAPDQTTGKIILSFTLIENNSLHTSYIGPDFKTSLCYILLQI